MYPGTYAAQFPDKPAVILSGDPAVLSRPTSPDRPPGPSRPTSPDRPPVLTYRELDENSTRLARYLRERGLRPGDHIALLTDNYPTAFEVYWAALRSGLYITAVNRHLSAPEVSYIVNDCGARALIVSARLADIAERIVPDTPAARIRLSYQGKVPGYEVYEDALASVSAEPLAQQPYGMDMLYSSGTTGRPKGIQRTLPNREITDEPEPGEGSMAIFGMLYGFGPDTVYLSPGPVYHAAPLRFCGLVHTTGGTVVLMEKFGAEAALAAIERYSVTHSQWVPTMFVRMLKLDPSVRAGYDLSSLRVAIHAAAPCPVDVKRAMIDWWGPVLQEYYASTEGNGVTVIDSEQWLLKPGSVGRAALGVIRICDSLGAELPAGETGTVYFERDEPPFFYHNDAAKTEDARNPLHPNWTTTGDVGYVDEKGFLFLTDRKAFMIISGGVNIYPQEIENALALHPKVYDVAVIGVPDQEMGESVLAVVHPAGGVEADPGLADELRAYLRERIAHYKVPRSFDFTDELPRTPTGKLVKGKLRERYL